MAVLNMNNYLDLETKSNYDEAYKCLKRTAVSKKWYYNKPTDQYGIIWHFTDINNMANILSYLAIDSKNVAESENVVSNNNAAIAVNDLATKNWVHDYARFYFRPKTPTQYRNEGIYEYCGNNFNKFPKSLKKGDRLWTSQPLAHLPVPIFIGFSLEKFLCKGGYITTRSLAGKNVSEFPEDVFDMKLQNFRKNITKIYSDDYDVLPKIKQTEFVMYNRLSFVPSDILKIIVRSEAEKICLLTMLVEHDLQLHSSQKEHQRVDIKQYIDRIIVDPDFFYNGRVKLEFDDNSKIYCNPSVEKENLKRIIIPWQYIKRDGDKSYKNLFMRLKSITLQLRDINNSEKTLACYHDPYWILGINKWHNRYFYSTIYYNHKLYTISRDSQKSADCWYIKQNNSRVPFTLLSENDARILKKVENSYQRN